MKLEAVVGDRIYATDGRKIFVRDGTDEFTHLSTLPNPKSGLNRLRYNLKTGGIEARVRRLFTGRVHSVNVWPIDDDVLFANAYRSLFVSRDGGESWEHSFELRESSGLRGAMPCGLCYRGGTVYLGEYIFDETKNPRVLRTDDLGRNWSKHVELEGVRHVHSVQADPYSNDIWITTGDRDDESIVGILRDKSVEVVGTGSQRWRTVQPVFLPDAIIWGTDAPYQDNHILRLDRSQIGTSDTDLEVLQTVKNPFYFGTAVDDWIFFSTNASARKDSTAPSATTYESDNFATIWGSSLQSGYREWNIVGKYEPKRTLARWFRFTGLSANSYIFLGNSMCHGLVYSPINTKSRSSLFKHPTENFNKREFNNPKLIR
ncbi:hypothetical protein ACLI4U_13430 [Natrialbaceae archaeon A-CW2]